MRRAFLTAVTGFSVAILAGCGGGGTAPVPLPELIIEFGDLIDDPDGPFAGSPPITTRDQALLIGSASYDGVALVTQPTDASRSDYAFLAIGDASARVDFADGTLRGSAVGFYELDTSVPGQLENTPGVPIDGTMTFSLTDAAPQFPTMLYSGSVTLDLIPTDRAAISLETTGTALFEGTQAEYLLIDGSPEDRFYEIVVFSERN